MKLWKTLLPNQRFLQKLSELSATPIFASRKNEPLLGSVFFHDMDGKLISLSWGYEDVEFKFEIYGISIDEVGNDAPLDLTQIAKTPDFSSIKFLLRTEWIRPALPDEVPAGFEQIVEEGGLASSVPSTAISAGTVLHGVAFESSRSRERLAIVIDEKVSYSLKVLLDSDVQGSFLEECDWLTLEEVLMWSPGSLSG